MKLLSARVCLPLIVVLSLALAACAPKASPAAATAAAPTSAPSAGTAVPTPAPATAQSPTATARAERPVVIVIPEEPPSFNAAVTGTGYDTMVMKLVLLGLTRIDPQGNVYPVLAAELPTQANGDVTVDEQAGAMQVTWHMRPDVVWSDGQPVTADDVLFTWDALKDPDKGIYVKGSDVVDHLEKVDDHTVAVFYSAIYPDYLTQLGGDTLAIWPKHYCDPEQGFSAWDCGRQPLSDGPYTLKEWAAGDHLTFIRNPSYFEPGKPAIDQIIVRIVPDESVRQTMLVKGDADVDMWISESVADQLKDEPAVKISSSGGAGSALRLFLNLSEKGSVDPAKPHLILADVRVRQAIRLAIDTPTIASQIFHGLSTPVWTELYRPPYNTCAIPQPKYDPNAARALLEQAGWIDSNNDGVRECHGCQNAAEGTPMEMEFLTYSEAGEALHLTQQVVAESLGQIGFKLNQSTIEGSVMWADSGSGGVEQTGNFDMDLWDYGYSGRDPVEFIRSLYAAAAAEPDQGWNVGRWINPDFDALLAQAYTLDETKRQAALCEMAKLLDNQVPEVLLVSTINADGYSPRMQGIQATDNDVVTWNVADWRVTQ